MSGSPLVPNPVSNQNLAENFYRFAKMITSPANPDLNCEMTKTSDRFAVATIVGIVTAGILTIIALIYIHCHKNSEVKAYFDGRETAIIQAQRDARATNQPALRTTATGHVNIPEISTPPTVDSEDGEPPAIQNTTTSSSLTGRAGVMTTTPPARSIGLHCDPHVIARLATQRGATSSTTTAPSHHQSHVDYHNMTEEERLQAALDASIFDVARQPVHPTSVRDGGGTLDDPVVENPHAAAAAATRVPAFFPLLTQMEQTRYRELKRQHGDDDATIGALVQKLFLGNAITYIGYTASGMSATEAFTLILEDQGRTAVPNAGRGEIADQDAAYYASLAIDQEKKRVARENAGTTINTQARGFFARRRVQAERARTTGPATRIQRVFRSRLSRMAEASGKSVEELLAHKTRMAMNARRLAGLQKRKATQSQPQTQVVDTVGPAAAPATPKLTSQQIERQQRAARMAEIHQKRRDFAKARAAAKRNIAATTMQRLIRGGVQRAAVQRMKDLPSVVAKEVAKEFTTKLFDSALNGTL